jgi:hypothetical protein
MNAMESGMSFLEAACEDKEIGEHIQSDDIRELFTLEYHLRNENSILCRLGLLDG